jgi:hypothetical protein
MRAISWVLIPTSMWLRRASRGHDLRDGLGVQGTSDFTRQVQQRRLDKGADAALKRRTADSFGIPCIWPKWDPSGQQGRWLGVMDHHMTERTQTAKWSSCDGLN